MTKKSKTTEYEVIIEPSRHFFKIDWKSLFEYRDLLFLLVRRDFISRYKQTILGPAWFILQPLMTTLVFTVIFGKVAKISTEGIPPMLFYLCGLLAWDYLSQCTHATSLSLKSNIGLFSKVYFPRLIVPLSTVVSNLMKYALQLVTFLGFFLYFKFATEAGSEIQPNRYLFFLPVFILQSALISLGVGLWVSAMTVRYRDFQHLMGFVIQLWMYATPVIYPLSIVPDAWKWAVLLNPMTQVVEFYRFAFFGSGILHGLGFALSWCTTLGLFFSGLFTFNKVERTFVDTI